MVIITYGVLWLFHLWGVVVILPTATNATTNYDNDNNNNQQTMTKQQTIVLLFACGYCYLWGVVCSLFVS